jgi:LemA protein
LKAPRTASPWPAAISFLAVQKYNTEIRTFPGRLWHSVMYSNLPIRETFEATPGSEKAPEVKF